MSAQPDTYMPPEHGWTCFHCGDTFMREVQAREHFGGSIDATPGCMLKLEKGDKQLLRVIRGLEAERDELRRQRCEEDSELLERASNEPPSGLPAPNVAALMSDLLDWASDAEDDETNNNGSSIVSAEGLRKLCYRAHAALSASAQPPNANPEDVLDAEYHADHPPMPCLQPGLHPDKCIEHGASQPQRALPEVGGDMLPTTLAQFEQRCKVQLADEQAKVNPDNALIGLLCDAVRLARENERMGKAGITSPPPPVPGAGLLSVSLRLDLPRVEMVARFDSMENAQSARDAFVQLVTTPEPPVDAHPEAFCEECNRPNATWFAPSEVWNVACRGSCVLCPVCFIKKSEAAGIKPTSWMIAPEGYSAQPPGVVERPQGHDDAQARIGQLVREIQMIADEFGYDPAQWLQDEVAQ